MAHMVINGIILSAAGYNKKNGFNVFVRPVATMVIFKS